MDIKQKIIEKINNEQLEEALALITESENRFEDDADFLNIKAVLFLKMDKYLDALNLLNKVLEIDKNNADACYNLAYTYERLGNRCDALDMYRKVLTMTEEAELIKQAESDIARLQRQCENSKVNVDMDGQESGEIIIIDTDSKIPPTAGDNIYVARSNVVHSMLNADAPLVSVCVLAYNNLDKYTRTCIECILKYTKDVDYELILVDNSSTDGTFEYFKSVKHPRKKIIKITKNIGAFYGGNMSILHAAGRYIVGVPNDVFVTKNWLSNMIKCALSDDRIGMVNPVSNYVSNYQSVDLGYADFDDMQRKAAEYNVSDPRKWEERLRLITLGYMIKRECLDIIGLPDYGFMHDFGDDDITFRIRRAGYKAILCKDVFVCHAGKITDKGSDFAYESLRKGRKVFKDKYYGIDAWDDINNYEPAMIELIEAPVNKGECRVLGIDVLCGTPLLEAKNRLRRYGFFNTKLAAFTTQAKYWLDLSTICDYEVKCDSIQNIAEHFKPNNFGYVIMGKPLNTYDAPYKLLERMAGLLAEDGSLLVKVRNQYDLKSFLYMLGQYRSVDEEIISHVDINRLNAYLGTKELYIDKMSCELHRVEENTKQIVLDMISKVNSDNADQIFNKLAVKDYVVKIKKKRGRT